MRTLTLALAVALAAWAQAAQAEDFVVIESSLPSFAVGSQLNSNAPVTLPDKARLVLLSGSGRTMVLTGPFQGQPKSDGAAGDGRLLTAVASLVRSNKQESGSVGAVRAGDIGWRLEMATELRDVLAIDASNGGDVCLYGGGDALLVKNPYSPAGSMNIQAIDGGAAATISWQPGIGRAAWPKALPIADGAQYLFEHEGQNGVAITTLHVIAAPAGASDMQRIVQLVEAGCEDQARLLLGMIVKKSR